MENDLFRLEQYQSLASTQELMKQKIRAAENVDRLIIRAKEQTEGRGRQGRKFFSKAGGSYQTIAFKDYDKKYQKPYAAIRFAISVAQEFEKLGFKIQIKWPNDLYYNNKKLAGILAEYLKDYLIVGIGINVANPLPEAAINIDLDLEQVNKVVETACSKAIANYSNKNLAQSFKRYDYLQGKNIAVKTASRIVRGKALGIDDKGCLILQTKNNLEHICSGSLKQKDLA